LLEHILPSLVRKPHGMEMDSSEHLISIRYLQTILQLPQKAKRTSVEKDYLRSMNLIQYVPLSEIVTAMELVLESKNQTLFNDLRDLLLRERRPANVIDINGWFIKTR